MMAVNNFDSQSNSGAQVMKVESADATTKRPYYGKCQYKTGKCFNERTLKRNGDAHSLCEEHRIKQNLIQRRSDRKYQTVHAIRRRERSQRRAVLKKQVSMAVAQQLFYEHQQQKSLGLPVSHPLMHSTNSTLAPVHPSAPVLAPPIHIPGNKMSLNPYSSSFLTNGCHSDILVSPVLSFGTQSPFPHHTEYNDVEEDKEEMAQAKEEESTPTGIDDFTPESFLSICVGGDESEAIDCLAPIVTSIGPKEMWTEDDIEFLQGLLLA